MQTQNCMSHFTIPKKKNKMENKFIPLSVPYLNGNEWEYVKDCLDTGWISSVGAYVNKFEEAVAQFVGAKYGISVVNGTAALHTCLILSGVKNGDYVIMNNITFVATANSVSYAGAEPILIDCDRDLWQMNLDLLEEFLTNDCKIVKGELRLKKDNRRIPVIMPVHVQGNIFDFDRFNAIVSQYPLIVIEDSTESLGSTYKGKYAGTFGTWGNMSFNGNKIISTGGGGVILTNDEALAKKAKHVTTTAKTDPLLYLHDEVGYNYRLVNILAAVGLAQMEQLPQFIERKKQIAKTYFEGLTNVGDIEFQKVLPEVEWNAWLFTIKTSHQNKLLKELNANSIQCRPFWAPMNILPMYSKCIYITKEDICKEIHETCLSIPCSTSITDEELSLVIESIKKVIN
jgi:perosamine synthetase